MTHLTSLTSWGRKSWRHPAGSTTSPHTFPGECCSCAWDLQGPQSSELITGSPPTSQMKKLRPQGSKSVMEWGLDPSLEGSLEGRLCYLSQGVVGCIEDQGFGSRSELAG